MTRTPASPQDEPPTRNTDEGSDDKMDLRGPDNGVDDVDEVVLIAIMSPANTIGSTNPEFHLMS